MAELERNVRPKAKSSAKVYDLREMTDYFRKKYRIKDEDVVALLDYIVPRRGMAVIDVPLAIERMENAVFVGLLYKELKEKLVVVDTGDM